MHRCARERRDTDMSYSQASSSRARGSQPASGARRLWRGCRRKKSDDSVDLGAMGPPRTRAPHVVMGAARKSAAENGDGSGEGPTTEFWHKGHPAEAAEQTSRSAWRTPRPGS
ncbi:unnamed protein product [Prorocentrum cordatum]|uniref:Uncharacterized protein n=1 Tax=Prorocentrum cordatum TaxID=2364126 RepID=A0ABN9YA75_9DINO|nr:unnamed protein product [Polarella glacialis]